MMLYNKGQFDLLVYMESSQSISALLKIHRDRPALC